MSQTFHGTLEDMGVNGPTLKQYLYDNWQAIVTQWAGINPPDNPYPGQPWLDISKGWSNAVLKFWNGSSWIFQNEYNPYIEDLKLARMAKDTLWQFLSVAHNPDGSLKSAQAENLTEWVDSALTATYVSATEFSVGGDQTDIFVQNRKIKATLDASVVYSAIDTSNYDDTGDETTVTLVDAVLDDTLQAIEYGLVKPGDSGSLPRLIASVIDFDDSNVSFFASEIQTAIENLNLATTPTGSVFHFAASSPPPGYLECNGAEISRTTYADLYSVIGTTFGEGDGSTTFNIPDLRGEFIRGYDNGRGVDSGRELGSWQSEELKSHSHGYTRAWSGNNNAMWHPNTTAGIATGSDNLTEGGNAILDTGGSETRPRNVTLLPCIKY